MTVERFDSLTAADFQHGAVRDEIRKTLEAVEATRARLVAVEMVAHEAVTMLRAAPTTQHAQHWDATGMAGVNCPACREHRRWREAVRETLDGASAVLR